MCLLIKYIKSVHWRVAKRLSYIEEARCLKVKPDHQSDEGKQLPSSLLPQPTAHQSGSSGRQEPPYESWPNLSCPRTKKRQTNRALLPV